MMQTNNDISERHAEITGLSIRQVTEMSDINTVSQLAGAIWRHHYKPIIGAAQVEYMLAHFQNPTSIESQISAGYLYYLLWRDEQPLAYFALLPAPTDKSLHLSKLYVAPAQQGLGLGGYMLAFTERYCRQQGFNSIWLTVNRHNQTAIHFYLRQGFINTGTLVQDIGAGFVMDDFKMLKNLD